MRTLPRREMITARVAFPLLTLRVALDRLIEKPSGESVKVPFELASETLL
jgi:hypothetical protein